MFYSHSNCEFCPFFSPVIQDPAAQDAADPPPAEAAEAAEERRVFQGFSSGDAMDAMNNIIYIYIYIYSGFLLVDI